MRNLFICHTQAQLILASGLALGRFKDDKNILILFLDFEIKDDLKSRLQTTFHKVLFLQSIYPAENNTIKAKLKWYPKDWKLIKGFLTESVDRAFAVCDWLLLVQKTLKLVYKANKSVSFAWLEDGITAYYKDSNIHKGLDRYKITMALRRFVIRDLLGIGPFYDRDFSETGGLKPLKTAYCCYPAAVREPYKSNRVLEEITDEEFTLGLLSMYPKSQIDIKPNSVVLVIDKLDRYAHPEMVESSLRKFINKCRAEGKHIVCKFHPRETQSWGVFDGCDQLDKTVGIESAYVSLSDIKDSITISGVKSTGLMTAKKLGYNTISLFPSCGEVNDNLITFYSALGITLY